MSCFRCFKYKAIDKYLIDTLVNSTLYFSSRERLNDPFDSKIDIKELITSLLDRELSPDKKTTLERIKNDSKFFQRFDTGYKDFGICSFSIDLTETLMWSHYAESHRGVALEYCFPLEFLDNPLDIVGVAPVIYERNTVSEWLLENVLLFEQDRFKFVTELLKCVLTAKAPAWSYEKEGRIIRPKSGLFTVSRSFLKGITFGLRTSASDISLIRSISEKYYDEIAFNKVLRAGTDFGIRVEDIS